MNRVLVVESGSKTKTIKSFLGDEYDVIASGGHIVDLSDDGLGIDLEDFSYTVEPLQRQGGGNAVEALQSKLQGADEVYLATDPDREGEAIAADIRDHAVPDGATVQRIEFNAIVYPAIMEALENPRDVNEQRVAAQRARRSLDRLIGFILSSITKFDPDGPGVPSVGRVQSPAVRLVVDREEEIEEFEVRHYWTVHAQVVAEDGTFEATFDGEWEEDEFSEVKSVIDALESRGTLAVETSTVDPESEDNPLPPYTTDSLQNDADFQLNFSPDRTMDLAQRLYEGVDIAPDGDGDTRALITYMRTDSTRVSPSALNLAKETLEKRDDLGEEMYRGRTWEPSGGAQDAHEAIRPTHPEDLAVWPDNLQGKLDDSELKLYTLIFKRFLASQMIPATYRETTLTLSADDLSATAVGNELVSPGFLTVWRDIRPDHGRDEVTVPSATVGSELAIERGWPESGETRPPPRYREGSLVSELKDRGIGRPSTYGDILTKVKNGPSGFGYVRRTGNTLQPTPKGESLVDYLNAEYPKIIDYEYTAHMESDLDRIENGMTSYEEYLDTEFTWLADPYEWAVAQGWLDSDKPTPAQIEYLKELAEETDTEIPSKVFDSKQTVSEWIDKLQEKIDPMIRLTSIYDADVNGVDVHRFRLYFNRPFPDAEYDALSDRGLKYKRGGNGSKPAFQYQRQDMSDVEACREELKAQYENGLEGYDYELILGGDE